MNTERDNSHSNRPAPKLSDTQLMLLSAAAQRDYLPDSQPQSEGPGGAQGCGETHHVGLRGGDRREGRSADLASQ